MKWATLEQFACELDAFMEAAQHERVVIMRGGKPLAVLMGIENKDEEDLNLEATPDFWRMIQERRRRPTVPLNNEVIDKLGR